jgi:hypothetical protein
MYICHKTSIGKRGWGQGCIVLCKSCIQPRDVYNNVAFRLLHRAVDDQVLKDIATKIEREKLRIAKLEQLSAKSGTPQDNTGMLDDRTSDPEMTSSSSDISMETKYQSEMAKQRTSRVQCTESEMAEQRTSGEQCSESEMTEQRTSGEQCTESEMAEQRTSGEQCTESEKPTQHSRQPNNTEHMEVEPPPGDTHMETEDTPSGIAGTKIIKLKLETKSQISSI